MFDQVRQAILPPVGLCHTLAHWPQIAEALADTPRRRTRQTAQLAEKLNS